MIPFFKLLAVVLLTLLGVVAMTQFDGEYATQSRVFGYPLVSIAQEGARGWIALGQSDAVGVVVIAQAGVGLIAFCQGGIGVLFFLGQAGLGLLTICQVGVGLFFFIGQLGGGAQALGQAAFISRAGKYLEDMNEEFTKLLAFSD